MSSDVAVRIAGLGKSYRISRRSDHVTLAEHLLSRVRHPFATSSAEIFWALKEVEFEVRRGEVLGLIGKNGAGKSTLLKVLSRITAPTTGRVEIFGRVGSLLEVGTGFHPELSGRENIFLNGAILGMRTSEVQRQFDAIVEFAGVERFLDTPVKRYSSGMYVRLAFAVAAHLETEILLVDEVLAVGDGQFQEKCIGKMGEVANSGRTVLFVSHSLGVIRSLCDRTVLLDAGTVGFDGDTDSAIARYAAGQGTWSGVQVFSDGDRWNPSSLPLDVKVTTGELVTSEPGHLEFREPIRLRISLETQTGFAPRPLVVLVALSAADGTAILSATSHQFSIAHGCSEVEVQLENPGLVAGNYHFEISIGEGDEFGVYKHSDVIIKSLPFEAQAARHDGGGVASYWPATWGRLNVGPLALLSVRTAEVDSRPPGPNR